jgi:hypothetical protein
MEKGKKQKEKLLKEKERNRKVKGKIEAQDKINTKGPKIRVNSVLANTGKGFHFRGGGYGFQTNK